LHEPLRLVQRQPEQHLHGQAALHCRVADITSRRSAGRSGCATKPCGIVVENVMVIRRSGKNPPKKSMLHVQAVCRQILVNPTLQSVDSYPGRQFQISKVHPINKGVKME
jgi:hypothetical protein